MITIERNFHGRKYSIEVGRIAKQAAGAAVVRCGETMVLVTACIGARKDGDFLPLTIDYVEKTYAAGRIPGGFFRREGRLSEHETLVSRLIDRPCRPLFPEGFTNEVQVIATVMSADPQVPADMLAMVGASAALTISEIPFDGPISGVRVGRIGGKLVINPTPAETESSDINMIVAGSKDAILMVEGGARQVPESELLDALFFAHSELQQLNEMQNELREKIGTPKMEWEPSLVPADLRKQVNEFATPKLKEAVKIAEKKARREAISAVKEGALAALIKEGDADAAAKTKFVGKAFEDQLYDVFREAILTTGRRIDGRDGKTVRPLEMVLDILPRAHGSALFQRGETQAIVVTTLGTEQEAQTIDALLGESKRHFMLHYNFPPFSVGETKMMRGPGRREIGHGVLAWRAIAEVLPPLTEFPYVLRVVSEITESNGSSSMASVCGGVLSLYAAGVPLKAPVAGIAMGLITDAGKQDRFAILTDILGDEDHLGDMDFKVCGSERGITAIQIDTKIKGLSRDVMTQALQQALEARLHILAQMNKVISAPRGELSPYAPRIYTFKINPDKIRDVIGPGGKTIRSITETCKVKVNITDDGTVTIAGNNQENIRSALAICESLTAEAEIGKIYKGVVKRVADYGAFVEILPGTDGLVHISQLADGRVGQVTDVVREGDEVWVKVLDVDRQGKIRLSRKEAMDEMGTAAAGRNN